MSSSIGSGGGLVSLPGAAGGESASAIGDLIENGKLAPDALQNGAVSGLGQLLGAQPPAEEAPPPPANAEQQAPSEEAVTPPKKGKKRQAARAEPARTPEATAAQALQSLFGN